MLRTRATVECWNPCIDAGCNGTPLFACIANDIVVVNQPVCRWTVTSIRPSGAVTWWWGWSDWWCRSWWIWSWCNWGQKNLKHTQFDTTRSIIASKIQLDVEYNEIIWTWAACIRIDINDVRVCSSVIQHTQFVTIRSIIALKVQLVVECNEIIWISEEWTSIDIDYSNICHRLKKPLRWGQRIKITNTHRCLLSYIFILVLEPW